MQASTDLYAWLFKNINFSRPQVAPAGGKAALAYRQVRSVIDWLIDWQIEFWFYVPLDTKYTVGHFRDVSPRQSHGLARKKINLTQ